MTGLLSERDELIRGETWLRRRSTSMQAMAMSVGGTSRPLSRPRGRAWRSKRGGSEAHACVLALPRTVASEASMRILGMGAESDVSTVLGGRGLLIELDWRCWVDAYDRQFTS
jgi:hypothetical protein